MNKYIRIGFFAGIAIGIVALIIISFTNWASAPDAPRFNPESMESLPVRILVMPTETDSTRETVLLYDGQGTSELASSNNGQSVRLIEAQSASYSCENDDCTRLDGFTSHPLFTPADFLYDAQDIAELQEVLVFTKESDCSETEDTCTFWEATIDDQAMKIEVSVSSNRIVLFSGTSPAGGTILQYEYPAEIIIELPETNS